MISSTKVSIVVRNTNRLQKQRFRVAASPFSTMTNVMETNSNNNNDPIKVEQKNNSATKTTTTTITAGVYVQIKHGEEEFPRKLVDTDFFKTNTLTGFKGTISSTFKRKSVKRIPQVVDEDQRQLMMRDCTLSLMKRLSNVKENQSSDFFFLQGARGVGKSVTLLQLVAHARENGWIVMYIPRAADFVTDAGANKSGTGTGVAIVPSSLRTNQFGQPLGAKRILEAFLASHGEAMVNFPQQNKYSHEFYNPAKESKMAPTLAHILQRGLSHPRFASDALFDLRMELCLIQSAPVLIAVDEFDALYWPTALWHLGKPVAASQLILPSAFRCLSNVPLDESLQDVLSGKAQATKKSTKKSKLSNNDNKKSALPVTVIKEHVPKYGAFIGATTVGLIAPSHRLKCSPVKMEFISPVLEGKDGKWSPIDKVTIPSYNALEVEKAVDFYLSRLQVDGKELPKEEKKRAFVSQIAAITSGNPELMYRKITSWGY